MNLSFLLSFFFEMVVVGIGLLVVAFVVHVIFAVLSTQFWLEDVESYIRLVVQIILAGALFHLMCEITSVNTWYCDMRCLND